MTSVADQHFHTDGARRELYENDIHRAKNVGDVEFTAPTDCWSRPLSGRRCNVISKAEG